MLECPSIQCLDLKKNRIEDADAIVDILTHMPNLALLYLQGNPCVRKIKNYRKLLIARIPTLKYLDDRPVFPEDRERAEVFMNSLDNGESLKEAQEKEKAVIERQENEKKEKAHRNFMEFQKLLDDAKSQSMKENTINEDNEEEEEEELEQEEEEENNSDNGNNDINIENNNNTIEINVN